jgi:tetratricopeptide (TPR) repeat protein
MASAALLAGCGERDTAADAVARGNQFYREVNYAAALQLYAEVEGRHPRADIISFNRGDAFAKAFEFEAAVKRYRAAAATDDPLLASQVQYNLGVVHYLRALDALQTFQDAMGYTRAAIRHWRASLELRPGQEDARYNLELAFRLAAEIDAQRAQARQNAETGIQKTADHRGQPFADEDERAGDDLSERDAEAKAGDDADAGQGPSGGKTAALARQIGRMQETGRREDLTPAAAERLLALMRQQAQAARDQRQAAQQVRTRAGRQDKFW